MNENPWVRISEHAFRRIRQRFPELRTVPKSRLKRMLVAISLKGEVFGDSVLDGSGYRRGTTPCGTPLIVSIRWDRNDPDILVVNTILTEEEAKNAGPYREQHS